VKVDGLVAATKAQRQATIKVAKSLYQFWNTGDDASLKAAIPPSFVDRALPPGRPQGREGPTFASKNFRMAVPDRSVDVRIFLKVVHVFFEDVLVSRHALGSPVRRR
jgi:hypothetical protein